ncbi:M16 family metallopeptidase [Leeia sp.]|uniref:M16 family metallopeptidase n=1 Tax=Leeia sp. TaxID=2884678 RepID=UPI0035AED0BE
MKIALWKPLLGAALLVASCVAWADAASTPLVADSRIVQGTWSNGMRYMIRRNLVPRNKVELRLIVQSGSMQETEQQQGYAHLLEHLAFRHTRHFQQQDVASFIESLGMRIGPDTNAHTSFNETSYELSLPTTQPARFKQGLQLLADWAGGIQFDPEDARKEAAIVTEEWRLREHRDAQLAPFENLELAGSAYLQRKPIGKMEWVAKADVTQLQAFYQQWYRPERMKVVAVGDIDPVELEAQLRPLMQAIPRSLEQKPFVAEPIPDADKTRAVVMKVDQDSYYVGFSWVEPHSPERTAAEYRSNLLNYLHYHMLRNRLRAVGLRPNQAFQGVRGDTDPTLDGKVRRNIWAWPTSYDLGGAWEAMRTEVERIRQHGFTVQEWARAKAESRVILQSQLDDDEHLESSVVVERLLNDWEGDRTTLSPADEQARVNALLQQDLLPEINALAKRLSQQQAIHWIRLGSNERYKAPDAERLLRIDARMAQERLSPFEPAPERPLSAPPAKPGTVVAEEADPEGTWVRWRFSNGAEALFYRTRDQGKQVSFAAGMFGGEAAVPRTLYAPATIIDRALNDSGAGAFRQGELDWVLATQTARLKYYVNPYDHGMQGQAQIQDLTNLLSLIHLRLTQPRFEEDETWGWLGMWIGRNRELSSRSDLQLQEDMMDKIWGGHYRKLMPSPGTVRQTGEDDFKFVARRLWGNPAALRFVFVADMDPEAIKPLLATWIGGLPQPDNWFKPETPDMLVAKGGFREIRQHSSDSQKQVSARKSDTTLYLTARAEVSEENLWLRRLVDDVLDRRLTKAIREDKALTYSVWVDSSLKQYEGFFAEAHFSGEASHVAEALREAERVIADLRTQGVTATELEEGRLRLLRQLAEEQQDNASLRSRALGRWLMGWPLRNRAALEAQIKAITLEQLNQRLKAWLAAEGMSVAQLNPRS